MTNDQKIAQYLKDLRRLTGLPLSLDWSGEGKENENENREAAIEQLSTLRRLCMEANDKEQIYREFLQGKIEKDVFLSYAVRTHLEPNVSRSLFLIRLKTADADSAVDILKKMFPDTFSTIFPIYPDRVVVIRQISGSSKTTLKETAYEFLNILNAELMAQVLISYGPIAQHPTELQDAYREAERALTVGTLFYPDRSVHGFDELDLGALIYELPEEACFRFVTDNLGKEQISDASVFFEDEILKTADCFLRCNLNIAETARQLHVHRNTLLYRLDQIQTETGLDIRRFHSAMTFKICSMILHYLKQKGKM